MSKFVELELLQIDASNNIRRPSPLLSNKGIDLIALCKSEGLGISMQGWLKFLRTVANDPKLVSIARSLAITGQLHPITVTKVGKDKYNCISGQRRYVGMVMVECLRNLLHYGDTEEVAAAKAIFEVGGIEVPNIDYAKYLKIKKELTISAEIKEEISAEEAERIAFTANEEAEPLTDIDWASWISKSKEKDNPATGSKYTWEELAKIAGKSVGWLRQRQLLLELPKEWKEKLDSREITISAASTYASEIVEHKAARNKPTPVAEPSAKLADTIPTVEPLSLESLQDAYEITDMPSAGDSDDTPLSIAEPVRVREGDSVEAESDEEPISSSGEEPPAKDWTEGTRKKRTKKPKMMKYEEIIELLRSMDKSDSHGIQLIATILKMEVSAAEEIAGSALDPV